MKPRKEERDGALLLSYHIILVLTLALAFLLIAGTIFALLRGRAEKPLFTVGSRGDAADTGGGGADAGGSSYRAMEVFTGIGRLRIPVAGPATVILSIAFPYPPEDRAFTEELASRVADFRRAAFDYFGSLDGRELERIDEEAAKAAILRDCNAMLRLGKIETLYFYDLMMIE
ncbi:MAG: flagellar basal body protein FliL [Treponema sp.]|jgi:flagellar basal body-associated protein FliL|nr:flagellar basal body protein FliL [Treponema sp.]